MKINSSIAKDILLEEADLALGEVIDEVWKARVESFSEICENTSKTHIAFLGTALLAKSVNIICDAFSVKAGDDSPGAYSARGLAHRVLVPLAPKLDINLGVTGREPLNNQPYFRIMRVSGDIPVRGNAQIAIDSLMELLETINELQSSDDARQALRAFIYVRRKYSPSYATLDQTTRLLSSAEIADIISGFVSENSEGGKRAQSVVAGLLDLFAGVDRVMSGRINDPDRHLPGDVGVRNADNGNHWDKVFEVRDKAVTEEDVYLFIQKAIENNVKEAAVVCAHSSQIELDISQISIWAKQRNIAITFYIGWQNFVEQIAFWSEAPQVEGLMQISQLVYDRLIEIEASEDAISSWLNLFKD